MLDQVSTLIDSIPKDKLSGLIDESYKAFGGSGYDLGSLFDSSSTVAGDLNRVGDRSTTLIEDSGPLLDSQAVTTDALRLWAQSLAGITGQVVENDPQVRTLLQQGPDAANEVSRLFDQIKPTLPVLLANLTTFGQVAVTYRPSLEQVLVLLPPFVANVLSSAPENNPTGIPLGDFRIQIADPNPCTVGFLPPSQWRSPADLTTIDTPDGLYCKLPQDSPIVVRGARNAPCMGVPGKRAPTVEQCYSDKPYEPLAMRQHTLGPNPIDPNLIAQGVPLDDRVDFGDRIYAPVEGTPPPPEAAIPPGPPEAAIPPGPPEAGPDGAVPAAPSSFGADTSGPGPSVAIAHLRSADRPVRHSRWRRVSTDRSRRAAEDVAGLDPQGRPMMVARTTVFAVVAIDIGGVRRTACSARTTTSRSTARSPHSPMVSGRKRTTRTTTK